MMRSKWEDPAGEDPDAPATLTIREVQALRRRAGFGVMGVLLALVAVAGLGWTLLAGPEGLAQIQDLKSRVLPVDSADTDLASTRSEPLVPAPIAPGDPATSEAPARDSTSAAALASDSPGEAGDGDRLATKEQTR
jgi:hypothetical protein